MSSDVTGHLALPADGVTAQWSDGEHDERVTLRWENEGWTATGTSESERIDYAVRLTAQWRVSQFLLFRDLEEADLWLGTDGQGRWGEVNGAHRPDLDGATDLFLACAPFTHAIPIRRLPLRTGHGAEISVLRIDVETLGVVPVKVRYERLADRRWLHGTDGDSIEFDVDEHGLPLDIGDRFRRVV